MRPEVELVEALLVFLLRRSWLLIKLEAIVGLLFRWLRLLLKLEVKALILGSWLLRTFWSVATEIEVEVVVRWLLEGILL